MSKITKVGVGAAVGGSVQIIKFEYTEQYRVEKYFEFEGEWTPAEAEKFWRARYDEIYQDVQEEGQKEVDRLEAMRDELNSA